MFPLLFTPKYSFLHYSTFHPRTSPHYSHSLYSLPLPLSFHLIHPPLIHPSIPSFHPDLTWPWPDPHLKEVLVYVKELWWPWTVHVVPPVAYDVLLVEYGSLGAEEVVLCVTWLAYVEHLSRVEAGRRWRLLKKYYEKEFPFFFFSFFFPFFKCIVLFCFLFYALAVVVINIFCF